MFSRMTCTGACQIHRSTLTAARPASEQDRAAHRPLALSTCKMSDARRTDAIVRPIEHKTSSVSDLTHCCIWLVHEARQEAFRKKRTAPCLALSQPSPPCRQRRRYRISCQKFDDTRLHVPDGAMPGHPGLTESQRRMVRCQLAGAKHKFTQGTHCSSANTWPRRPRLPAQPKRPLNPRGLRTA